jgi:hypothetical protein
VLLYMPGAEWGEQEQTPIVKQDDCTPEATTAPGLHYNSLLMLKPLDCCRDVRLLMTQNDSYQQHATDSIDVHIQAQ